MKRLEIQGVNIILDESINVALTFSSNDVRDITKRSTTFSQSFNLESTADIDEVFSYAFDVNVLLTNAGENSPGLSYNNLKRIKAKYFENESLILDGFIRLIDVRSENGKIIYNVNLLGSYNNILNDMGEDTLQILDTGLTAFGLSESEINSQNTGNSALRSTETLPLPLSGDTLTFFPNPLYFAPVDYGGSRTSFVKYDSSGLTIGFKVAWVFNAIIEKYGYTLDSESFFRKLTRTFNSSSTVDLRLVTETPYIANAIFIPPQRTNLLSLVEVDRRKIIVSASTYNHEIYPISNAYLYTGLTFIPPTYFPAIKALNTDPDGAQPLPTTSTPQLGFAQLRQIKYNSKIKDTYNRYHTNNYEFIAPYTVDYDLQFDLDFVLPSALPNRVSRVSQVYIQMYVNNIYVGDVARKFYGGTNTTGTTSANERFIFKKSFKAGDKVRFQMGLDYSFYNLTAAETAAGITKQIPQKIIINGSTLTISQTNVETGSLVNINSYLSSDIKCKDFFLGVIKHFNLQIDINRDDEKKLTIEPFFDFYTTDYIDLSDRVMRDKTIKVQPLSELTSKRYVYKYKYEEDYWNKYYKTYYGLDYGLAVIDIDSDFASTTPTTFESFFAHSPIVDPVNESIQLPSIITSDGVNNVAFGSKLPRLYGINNFEVSGSTQIPFSVKFPEYGTYRNFYGAYSTYVSYTTEVLELPYSGSILSSSSKRVISVLFDTPSEVFYTTVSFSSKNIFTEFHQPQLDQIADLNSRLVTISIDADEQFISDLSFRRLLMVDNTLFRLNKLQYNGKNQPCTVELLKAISYAPREIQNAIISTPPKEKFIIDGGKDIVFKPYPLKQIFLFDGGKDINQGPRIDSNDWTKIDGGFN